MMRYRVRFDLRLSKGKTTDGALINGRTGRNGWMGCVLLYTRIIIFDFFWQVVKEFPGERMIVARHDGAELPRTTCYVMP